MLKRRFYFAEIISLIFSFFGEIINLFLYIWKLGSVWSETNDFNKKMGYKTLVEGVKDVSDYSSAFIIV